MKPADRVWLLEVKPVRRVTPSIGTVTSFYFCQGPPGVEDRTLNGVVWRKRLAKVFDRSVQAFAGADGGDPRPLGGRSLPSVGQMTLLNGDGALTPMLRDYAFCGVDYILRIGRAGDAWGAFTIAQSGWIADVEFDAKAGTVTLTPVDLAEKLERPVQDNVYAGGGGVDGTDDLKDKPLPLLWGEHQLFAPTLIDEYLGTPVYQLSDGGITNLIHVYERGLIYGSGSYVDTVADVYAWTPVTGRVAVDLTNGLMRLPVPFEGVITVRAIKNLPAHAGAGDSHANAMYEAATHAGVLASGDIDLASFEDLHDADPSDIGFLIQDVRSIASVLDELCASCGALWTFTQAQQLRVKQVAFGAPVDTITAAIVCGTPKRLKTAPPVYRVRRKWSPRRPHTPDEISPARDLAVIPSSGTSAVTGGDKTSFTVNTAVETQWSTTEGAYIGRRVELSVNPATAREVLITNYHLEAAVARVTIGATLAANLDATTRAKILAEVGLAADARAGLTQEWRTKDFANSQTLTWNPRARDVERAYFHVADADADTEAGRQRSLESVFPDRFEIAVRDRFLAYQLGDTVTVDYAPLGLVQRDCLIMGMKGSADDEIETLTLWSQTP